MTETGLLWDRAQITGFAKKIFPQVFRSGAVYEFTELESLRLVARLAPTAILLRPGGVIAGPVIMAMADFSTYALLLARHGEAAIDAVTTNLQISFLRKAEGDHAVLCEVNLIKAGRQLSVLTCHLYQENNDKLIAHAETTYFMSG